MTEKKAKLSTESYKGVRDFYPEDMFIQNYIFGVMRKTVEKYGYSEYNASLLEPTELYSSKTSEEIVNEQTYSFKDRGDRDITLRPEMTPTVARMVAGKRKELTYPIRWYSIPNVFRYERPQRGRLREHWQLNVDMFGSNSPEADIEMITLASHIMYAFGATDSDFEIKINNKGNLKQILSSDLKLSDEETKKFLIILDKKNKLTEEEYKQLMLQELGKEVSFEISPGTNTEKIIQTLKDRGIKNVVFEPNLVRGFDYYTGTVFEVFDTNPENKRSVFGGGRYDDLTKNFDDESLPAIGFGMGDVTIRDFLETRNLLPEYNSGIQVYIGVLDEQFDFAEMLAENLRKNNINVFVNFDKKDMGDHFKQIEKRKIPYGIFIGSNEVKNNTFTIRNIKTRTNSHEYDPDEGAEAAKDILDARI